MGRLQKTYLARVNGHCEHDTFECEQPISTEPSTAGTRTLSDEGRSALTKFEVAERFDDGTSLVICRPVTGRTHQIRLHLSHLGFPIQGDLAYAVDAVPEATQTLSVDDPPMCLHAWKIEIDHPEDGKRVEFEAPRPEWAKR